MNMRKFRSTASPLILLKALLSMSETSGPSKQSNPPENAKLARVACDQCHRCKLRCTRELPCCERCSHLGSPCTFSTGKPIGKPRGRKNKNSRTAIITRKEKQDQTGEPTPCVLRGDLANRTHSRCNSARRVTD